MGAGTTAGHTVASHTVASPTVASPTVASHAAVAGILHIAVSPAVVVIRHIASHTVPGGAAGAPAVISHELRRAGAGTRRRAPGAGGHPPADAHRTGGRWQDAPGPGAGGRAALGVPARGLVRGPGAARRADPAARGRRRR